MSYILDALKKADAERERGAVPGLHTRQVTSVRSDAAPATSRAAWLAVTIVLALGVIAAGLWAWGTARDVPLKHAPEPAIAQVAPPAPTTQSLPEPIAAPVAKPAAAPVAVPVPTSPARAAGAEPVAPPVVVSAPTKSAPSPAAVASAAATEKPLPAVAPPAASAASASPTASYAVPLLSELSEELRRQVPALTITGVIYSDDPKQRLLVVNNRVLNQGSEAAPDVRLEEIGINSSVFSIRGNKFRLGH